MFFVIKDLGTGMDMRVVASGDLRSMGVIWNTTGQEMSVVDCYYITMLTYVTHVV